MDWFPGFQDRGQAASGPTLGCVLVANNSNKAYVPHVSQHLGSDIRTARMVAHEFRKQFFPSVWIDEARLDRYLCHG